jgi:hypothetical protein
MKTFIVIILILGTYQFACAQTDAGKKRLTKKSYWFDAGLGWGGQGSAQNFGFVYEIAPKRIISVHYSGVMTNHRYTDYLFFIPVASYPAGEDADSYEVTYGYLTKGKFGVMTLSAGLSVVNIQSGSGHGEPLGFDLLIAGSTRPADYKLEKSNTVGLALRAEFIPSLRWAGFGISPSVNINPQYTFASIAFQLALGRMRPKDRKVEN